MGLDMYAYAISATPNGTPDMGQVDVRIGDFPREQVEQIAYWRKVNHLHGWMERLYRKKGGTAESFNCRTVRLMPDDLDALALALIDREKEMPPTSGFFFGGPAWYDEDTRSIRDFIARARDCIANGDAVYYDSWW